MAIVHWRPFGDIADWSDEIEERMRQIFDKTRLSDESILAPRADIKENDDAFEVIAELPGMEKKDISVSMSEGVLSISGEKRAEERKKGENWHRTERVFGSFRRSFYIPSGIDQSKIKASYKNGVLKVVLPKKEDQKLKEIPVEVE